MAAPKDCQEVLHLLVRWSLLSLPPRQPPPPTGLGLPQQLLRPPHLISPPALPPAHVSFPGFWHSIAQSSHSFPHPRQPLGQGWGDLLPWRAGAQTPPSDEEEGRGRPWQPAWHVCLLGVYRTQESRPQPKHLLPARAPISPRAKLPEAVGAAAKSRSSGSPIAWVQV